MQKIASNLIDVVITGDCIDLILILPLLSLLSITSFSKGRLVSLRRLPTIFWLSHIGVSHHLGKAATIFARMVLGAAVEAFVAPTDDKVAAGAGRW